ncbi:MAG: ice-binding family protein, partial [Bacteriovorax sp.]|nr:ice-binding family protein [Bacteriovorax sp.]
PPNSINLPIPRKLKALKIGSAENFSLLAYASINSVPNSKIFGKVGLFPGTRAQINLDPEEVIGGAGNIFGSDDDTNPINLLSIAKLDMVSAYNEAQKIIPDLDKVALSSDFMSKKNLSSGCYKWKGDLVIMNDVLLEGSESDVWIFKIPSNLKISNGVHLTLSGGAKASNVFWQVAGNVTLGPGSKFVGTIIAQQFIQLEHKSSLVGRAFAKNGYINLDQASILKP